MLFRSLPVPVAMSSGEAEYISAAVACMRASHLRMLIYDLKCLCSEDYDRDNMKYDVLNNKIHLLIDGLIP